MTNDAGGDVVAIVRASYEAYAQKNRERIESLISRDFHFTSPLDNRIDRTTYFARCWPNSENIVAFEFIQLARDRETVFVTYEGRSRDNHRFRNTERVTVRGGQIHEVEVYFGWTIPHPAPEGRFINPGTASIQAPDD